ncbi:MAG: hypothetical protein GX359_11585 [Clostridiales bacterium]|nr:hypothetical protein [Clostridiales bacterium]
MINIYEIIQKYKRISMILIVIIIIQTMIISILLSKISCLENNFNHYQDWRIVEKSGEELTHEKINK